MTGEEIAKKINENERKIESLLNPAQFILSKEIRDLLDENMELKEQCPHKFVNGICEFCHKEEKNG